MMAFAKKHMLRLVVASAMLGLAACGPLISFGGDGPSAVQYSLIYPGGLKEGDGDGPVVAVSTPDLLTRLNGRTIAVLMPDSEHTTLSGARWSGHLGDMLQDYLIASLSGVADATLVGRAALDVRVDCRIGVKVWEMDFIPANNAQGDKVAVAVQMMLVRMSDSSLLGQKLFSAEVAPTSSNHTAIVKAFNKAMAENAANYSAWFRELGPSCMH